ncbi:MAG: helix-turn-helix transcriptional regulator [Nostoc sp.]|uniref:helix-turn-helix domain-containing protein n=1 Tax=Nostoc sp. TaxID=1180 RepID=UPI002FFC55F0
MVIIQQPEVGKLILKLRTIAGLRQEEFATSLGVTYSTVNRWKNGHGKASCLAVQRIEGMLEEIGEQGQDLLVKYLQNNFDSSTTSIVRKTN